MKIPEMTCNKGCSDCCGIVLFSDKEKEAAINAVPFMVLRWRVSPFKAPGWVLEEALKTRNCPFIKDSGCMIYDHRPMVCRLFGVVDYEHLTCPHGCGPEKKLTREQGRDALLRSIDNK